MFILCLCKAYHTWNEFMMWNVVCEVNLYEVIMQSNIADPSRPLPCTSYLLPSPISPLQHYHIFFEKSLDVFGGFVDIMSWPLFNLFFLTSPLISDNDIIGFAKIDNSKVKYSRSIFTINKHIFCNFLDFYYIFLYIIIYYLIW